MAKLLISKINGIEVIQHGESKISSENQKQDEVTTSGEKDKSKTIVKNTGNRTKDLGKGKQTYSFSIYVVESAQARQLQTIFRDERFCTITDKYLGRLRVYVNSWDVVNNDTHVGIAFFTVNCTLQDKKIEFAVNWELEINEFREELTDTLSDDVEEVGKVIGVTVASSPGSLEPFADKKPNLLFREMKKLFDKQEEIQKGFNYFQSKANSARRLLNSIRVIASFPADLTNQLKDFAYNTKQGFYETEKIPIPVPTIRGVPVTEELLSKLSSSELKKVAAEQKICNLAVKTKLIKDLGIMVTAQVGEIADSVIKRIEYLPLAEDKAETMIYAVKSYSNARYENELRLTIERPEPLISILHRYGIDYQEYDTIGAGIADKENYQGVLTI